MARDTQKARTRHTNYTPEAFREIAEAALEEVIENASSLEIKDLTAWSHDLKRRIGHVSDRQDADDLDTTSRLRGDE